jgi:acyl carrier protein
VTNNMQSNADSTELSFAQFAAVLEDELGLSSSTLTPNSSLESILDSLSMYELVLLIEDYVPEISETELMSWHTFGDVYGFLQAARESPHS